MNIKHFLERPAVLNDIAQAIAHVDGKAMFVGGFVRDSFLKKPSKDFDIEVYNVPYQQLVDILSEFGTVNVVGQSFGVIKLSTGTHEYDFSLPRKESKRGPLHTDYEVEPIYNLSFKEACSRRDFTINAMMEDVRTGEIHDYYHGQEHLRSHLLVATTSKFAEDALRVLRGMQLAARFNLFMDSDTVEMCRGLLPEYNYLSNDRIMVEWLKLAEKCSVPSKGLRVLQDTGWLSLYPELTLTPFKMQAIDRLARKQNFQECDAMTRSVIFFTVLMNDVHPIQVGTFLKRISMPDNIQKRILALKKAFDSPHSSGMGDSNARNLAYIAWPETIGHLLIMLEAMSRDKERATYPHLADAAQRCDVREHPPLSLINGNLLMKENIVRPGPKMGCILTTVYQAQLDGKITTFKDAMTLARTLTDG